MLQIRVAVQGNKTLQSSFWWTAVVLWMGAIFAVSSIPSVATPFEPFFDFTFKKLAHMAEYATLTVFLFNALLVHFSKKPPALLTAALIATLYAFSDEWHQTFVPGREGTLRDVGIDALGVLAASFAVAKRKPDISPRRRRGR